MVDLLVLAVDDVIVLSATAWLAYGLRSVGMVAVCYGVALAILAVVVGLGLLGTGRSDALGRANT